MNNVERDVTFNTYMPKLKNAGWEEGQTCSIVDEKGIKTDLQTIFVNRKVPGRVFINKMTNSISIKKSFFVIFKL